MNELANHLLQSTLFAAAAASATVALRRNAARVRYWLWLAASLKFLIPFSLLVSIGGRVEMPAAVPRLPAVSVEQISMYFAPVRALTTVAPAEALPRWTPVIAAVWFGGSLLLLLRWFDRWRTIHRAVRSAKPLSLRCAVPVLSSPSLMEPGVFGVFRPLLLLPEGITSNLRPAQLEAILAHELCHVRHRDNLTAALHMCVETLFWFHPLIWWIGARLIAERERDCDESVLRQGSRPHDYVQGILTVCKSYVESRLPCTTGVTGSDLRVRIREIMTQCGSLPMTPVRKATLMTAGLAAVAVPTMIGVLQSQTHPPAPAYTYDAVSIRPSKPGPQASGIGPGPQGGVQARAATVIQMLTYAYGVRDIQIVGGPAWTRSERFDATFTPDKPEAAPDPAIAGSPPDAQLSRNRQRMQAVLRDRFGLVLLAETKDMSLYALTIAGNHKLIASKDASLNPSLNANRKQITATNATLKMLTDVLSTLLGSYVTNETGLTGPYDFRLEWTADSSVQLPGKFTPPGEPERADDAGGTSLLAALREQLGLRLQSRKGPVPVLVIEKIQKPTEN